MRITMAITVTGEEEPRRDFARLWRRVWLVVAAWILLSCKVKWRERERGRKNMDGGGRIIRVSRPQTGKGGDGQGRKAQLNMRVFAFPKNKDNQFQRDTLPESLTDASLESGWRESYWVRTVSSHANFLVVCGYRVQFHLIGLPVSGNL